MTGRSFTEIDLYRNTEYPLHGSTDAAASAFPGSALSANTCRFYADKLQDATIEYARWFLAWNPKTGATPTGVYLCKFDEGPANINSIAHISGASYCTPRTDGVDVTSALQSILAGGVRKNLGHQTYGNGSNGCLIYGSWIEIVWG